MLSPDLRCSIFLSRTFEQILCLIPFKVTGHCWDEGIQILTLSSRPEEAKKGDVGCGAIQLTWKTIVTTRANQCRTYHSIFISVKRHHNVLRFPIPSINVTVIGTTKNIFIGEPRASFNGSTITMAFEAVILWIMNEEKGRSIKIYFPLSPDYFPNDSRFPVVILKVYMSSSLYEARILFPVLLYTAHVTLCLLVLRWSGHSLETGAGGGSLASSWKVEGFSIGQSVDISTHQKSSIIN